MRKEERATMYKRVQPLEELPPPGITHMETVCRKNKYTATSSDKRRTGVKRTKIVPVREMIPSGNFLNAIL